MENIEANIIEGINNIEKILFKLKASNRLPLGVLPRVQMIEQLFRNLHDIIDEDKQAINGKTKRNNTLFSEVS